MFVQILLSLIFISFISAWDALDTVYPLKEPLKVGQNLTVGVHPHGEKSFGVDYLINYKDEIIFHMHCYYGEGVSPYTTVIAYCKDETHQYTSEIEVKTMYIDQENVFQISYESKDQIRYNINGEEFVFDIKIDNGQDIIAFSAVRSPNVTFVRQDF
ncbi:unnamed protein product [Bursaphelenchus okinawaensis]|uniref:Galectin n=1 Tax=Bursaphelenchus okinawaensis TaxID=465554 RepID=A0A811JPW3_9BILA|nr:unnamed protein product [Bursaphelenchus okinawaensis]CAG9077175.1 unnamed protein product [Bursaphelenchus okinawaensis]